VGIEDDEDFVQRLAGCWEVKNRKYFRWAGDYDADWNGSTGFGTGFFSILTKIPVDGEY